MLKGAALVASMPLLKPNTGVRAVPTLRARGLASVLGLLPALGLLSWSPWRSRPRAGPQARCNSAATLQGSWHVCAC